MKRLTATLLAAALAGCVGHGPTGDVSLTLQAPSSIRQYAPFAPQAETDGTEAKPCATLAEVEVSLKNQATDETLQLKQAIAESGRAEFNDIPVGDYVINVSIIALSKAEVYAGVVTAAVGADQINEISLTLVETGGCPRPNPGAPTALASPLKTGCDALRISGFKPESTFVMLVGDPNPSEIGEADATTWFEDIPMTGRFQDGGFSFETIWSDDKGRSLKSVDRANIQTEQDESVLCFNPYDPASGHFDLGGSNADLAWDEPSDPDYLGVVWYAYTSRRSAPPIGTSMAQITAPSNAEAELCRESAGSENCGSILLPSARPITLEAFSAITLPTNEVVFRNSGSVEIRE